MGTKMIHTIIALILFLFPLAYSPGPGNMFFAANGARFGFRATIPANAGYHIATWIVTVAIGLGFVAAVEQYPEVFSGLKVAGSGYITWLAWKMIRAGALAGGSEAKPSSFVDGAFLLVLNPKGYVIITLMFSQFLGRAETVPLTFVLLISTVFTLNNLVAFSLWAFIGDRIAGYFRAPESARRLNIVFGGALTAVAVWMMLT